MFTPKAAVALFLLVGLCACSSSGDGPAATPDAAAGNEQDSGQPGRGGKDGGGGAGCERLAAFCRKLAECAPFMINTIYGDVQACTQRVIAVCAAQQATAESGMSEANLVACESALHTATCDVLFANDSPCKFEGKLDVGATCGDDTQCSTGFCQRADNLCGICAAKAGAGQPCPSGANEECQHGLVCASDRLCVQPARVGAACDDKTQPCLTGLFCTTANTCALPVAAGQECPGGYLNLVDGTLCWGRSTPSSQQLATQLGLAKTGFLCGLAPETGAPPTLCSPGGVTACSLTSDGIQLFGLPTKGICAGAIPDGHTCKPGQQCEPGAQCINELCKIPSGRYCNTP